MDINRFILTAFISLILVGCESLDVDNPPSNVSVTIKASGLSDGALPLNNSASFSADVAGFEGDLSSLIYRWILATGRGELSDGSTSLSNPSVGGNSIRCNGNTAGEEQISVEVLDANNRILAIASFAFMIVPPTDTGISRGCFDQPKFIFQQGSSWRVMNFDGSERQSIGASGGTTAAISPNGEWIAWNDDSTQGWDMWVQRCDGTDKTMIPGGTSFDFSPRFSRDSKTLYFVRPEPSQERPNNNTLQLGDIAAYDLETRELRFLTTLYQLNERVSDFTVSAVTGEIAFFRVSYKDLPSGGFEAITKLSLLQPSSGLIRDFTTLPQGRYDFGLDWSPDGADIIYSALSPGERGIYRINLTDGSEPLLLNQQLWENSAPPYYPHYYAGGSRIVYMGQANGQTNINLLSVDTNGNDLQQITDTSSAEILQGVLH